MHMSGDHLYIPLPMQIIRLFSQINSVTHVLNVVHSLRMKIDFSNAGDGAQSFRSLWKHAAALLDRIKKGEQRCQRLQHLPLAPLDKMLKIQTAMSFYRVESRILIP